MMAHPLWPSSSSEDKREKPWRLLRIRTFELVSASTDRSLEADRSNNGQNAVGTDHPAGGGYSTGSVGNWRRSTIDGDLRAI